MSVIDVPVIRQRECRTPLSLGNGASVPRDEKTREFRVVIDTEISIRLDPEESARGELRVRQRFYLYLRVIALLYKKYRIAKIFRALFRTCMYTLKLLRNGTECVQHDLFFSIFFFHFFFAHTSAGLYTLAQSFITRRREKNHSFAMHKPVADYEISDKIIQIRFITYIQKYVQIYTILFALINMY